MDGYSFYLLNNLGCGCSWCGREFGDCIRSYGIWFCDGCSVSCFNLLKFDMLM